jgi:hypothetical protein
MLGKKTFQRWILFEEKQKALVAKKSEQRLSKNKQKRRKMPKIDEIFFDFVSPVHNLRLCIKIDVRVLWPETHVWSSMYIRNLLLVTSDKCTDVIAIIQQPN